MANDSGEIGKCSECKKKKNLTLHGTCWKCHLKGININARIEVRAEKTPTTDYDGFKKL